MLPNYVADYSQINHTIHKDLGREAVAPNEEHKNILQLSAELHGIHCAEFCIYKTNK
jgi:hypothetical protein